MNYTQAEIANNLSKRLTRHFVKWTFFAVVQLIILFGISLSVLSRGLMSAGIESTIGIIISLIGLVISVNRMRYLQDLSQQLKAVDGD